MPYKDPKKNKESKDNWAKRQVLLNPNYQRERWLKCVYGLSLDTYTKMLHQQNGVCAICGECPPIPKGRKSSLFVDHDHKTGSLRGLLCHKCNIWLAALESVEWAQKATVYLTQHAKSAEPW